MSPSISDLVQILRFLRRNPNPSPAQLQRRFKLGYNQARRLIDAVNDLPSNTTITIREEPPNETT